MEESNVTTCRVCNQLKVRKQDGLFKSKNKKWVDETGHQWNGRTCPDCNRLRARGYMCKVRKEDETRGIEGTNN